MESDELLPSNKQVASGGAVRGGRGVLPESATSSTFFSSESLVSRAPSDGNGGRAAPSARARPPSLLTRQEAAHSDDAFWEVGDIATSISRDLVEKAKRWKQLAGEPSTGTTHLGGDHPAKLPEIAPLLAHGIDKHEVASICVKDALAGRESSACIHNRSSLRALKLVRNKAWNQLLNVCTIFHLILPMVEIPRCLPCLGVQPDSLDLASLHEGWRPTGLGSTWVECFLCLLYVYDLRQENRSKLGDVCVTDGGGGGDEGVYGNRDGTRFSESSPTTLSALPPWQLARTCMVTVLALGLMSRLFSHYVLEVTWHSWGRVILPFLFISRRTYLKHFVAGIIRVLPRMLPVAFLISFVVFFYGFLGYIVYRNQPVASNLLRDLDLFGQPMSSALTFLRIFTARSYMLDVEVIFGGRKDIQVMVLSYAVIMVIFLGALIPAVANRNFQNQSAESYHWVKEQRALALTRAYMLLKQPDGSVTRKDWVRLMECLRPDCSADHTSALFGAAKKAEERQMSSLSAEHDRNKVSKAGFFMLCALGTANFSQGQNEREKLHSSRGPVGPWMRFRRWLDDVLSWSKPGSTFPVSQQVLNVALLVQGYQIVREGDEPEERPAWAYPLGGVLIAYFCLQAVLRMIAEGPRSYMSMPRNSLGMVLNLIGVAYYTGFWFRGEAFHSLYQIVQASRLIVLWNVLHLLGPTTSEVARRLEFVSPSVIRASVVLFSVIYSYSVVAYALFCATPMGQQPIDTVKDHSMVKRFAAVKEVASFESLHHSFASLLYVLMLSNWPMFMDAAGVVEGAVLARLFFYSFKVLTFYIVMPLTIGFIVQSYMAARMPESEADQRGFRTTRQTSGSGALSSSRSYTKLDGEGGGGEGMEAILARADPKQAGGRTRTYVAAFAGGGGGGDGHDEGEEDGPGQGIDDDDLDSSEDDILAPVMIASSKRSMSQQFWGLQQAKDASTAQKDDTVAQGTVERLEDENAALKDDNARLRALVESIQQQTGAPGATAAPLMAVKPPAVTSSRRSRTVSSETRVRGTQAIAEAEDEETGGGGK